MKLIITILLFAFFSFNKYDREIQQYEDDKIKCLYETNQGRVDGKYVSYYKNGLKKSEGEFENNYRIGKWTVWDSTGRVRMQRVYSDPFTFNRLVPEIPNDKTIELLNAPIYLIQKNHDGYINYFPLKERMVVWSERIWRIILPTENPILFDNNLLFGILNKNLIQKNISAYEMTGDDFSNKVNVDIDTSSIKLIGFKIKEDFFFDNERLVSESRIIGICPVVENKLTQDTMDLYWVYFPHIRKYLAQEKIEIIGLPENVKTLDDLFFYRYFSGQIYKKSNDFEKPIKCYMFGKEIDLNSEKTEISLIEMEHDLWIHFTK